MQKRRRLMRKWHEVRTVIYPLPYSFSALPHQHRVDNCTRWCTVLRWPGRWWQSLVGLIPSGWLTQLPIKIQLPRTATATTPNSTQTACSLAVRSAGNKFFAQNRPNNFGAFCLMANDPYKFFQTQAPYAFWSVSLQNNSS